jgi:pimeloyl-ACP methyl ester carboxylesterase
MEAMTRDGTVAEAVDEGMGAPILVLHGGMGDRTAWAPVTDLLRERFRTVRLHRRQYRLDLAGPPVTMAQELEHVSAIAALLDRPLLVGHSSGAVLALEALVAEPGTYSGAVLYEPPLVTGPPLGGAGQAAARAALDAGRPGRAFRIFLRDVVGMPPAIAYGAGLLIGRDPQMAARVPRQLDDNDAIDALGVRLDAYATIDVPVLLIGGDRSPRHLTGRLDALQRRLPHRRRLVLHGQGHLAQQRAPERVARAIARHYDDEVAPVRPRTTS